MHLTSTTVAFGVNKRKNLEMRDGLEPEFP
jgi:hypothetical protein